MLLAERNACDERYVLPLLRFDRHAGERDGFRRRRAAPAEHVQPGRPDLARVVLAAIAVGEDDIAVRVEEVGGTERAEIGRERANLSKASIEARRFVLPERGDAFEQGAERLFRVGVADSTKAACPKEGAVFDPREHSVVRKEVDSAAQLPRERLRVAQGPTTLRRVPNMGEGDRCPRPLLLEELDPPAAMRGVRFADDERIAVLPQADAPPIPVRSRAAAVPCELVEREADRRGKARGHREELTHERPRIVSLDARTN